MNNKYTGVDVKNVLLEGSIIYLDDDNCCEKRLYRYNNLLKLVEYSDDYFNWSKSNMSLDDFMNNVWVIFKK